VPPFSRRRDKGIEGQKLPAKLSHKGDGAQHKLDDLLRQEVVEIQPHEPRTQHLIALQQRSLVLLGQSQVDAQQPLCIRSGTGAASPHLQSKKVVEQRGDVIVVQISCAVPDVEGQHREPLRFHVSENVDRRMPPPGLEG
jgi:hypothetical protein